MNILYIEDDKQIADAVRFKLRSRFNVDVATCSKKGIEKFENKEFNLVIIDYYLPDFDGITTCKRIREFDKKTPILMLTTNDRKENIIEALDSGADDYLTKPFNFNELEARIRALIRRTEFYYNNNKKICLGELVLNLTSNLILCNNHVLNLSRQEFLLLRFLLLNKEKLISRRELYEHVWGNDDYYNSNTIDVHIRRLRKKIMKYSDINYIKSVYGLGYKLNDCKK